MPSNDETNSHLCGCFPCMYSCRNVGNRRQSSQPYTKTRIDLVKGIVKEEKQNKSKIPNTRRTKKRDIVSNTTPQTGDSEEDNNSNESIKNKSDSSSHENTVLEDQVLDLKDSETLPKKATLIYKSDTELLLIDRKRKPLEDAFNIDNGSLSIALDVPNRLCTSTGRGLRKYHSNNGLEETCRAFSECHEIYRTDNFIEKASGGCTIPSQNFKNSVAGEEKTCKNKIANVESSIFIGNNPIVADAKSNQNRILDANAFMEAGEETDKEINLSKSSASTKKWRLNHVNNTPPKKIVKRKENDVPRVIQIRDLDQGTKKNDQNTKKNGQDTKENDEGSKENDQGTKENDQGTKENNQGKKENGQDTKENNQDKKKNDQGTKKNAQSTKTNDQGTKENDQGTKKNDQDTKKNGQGRKDNDQGTNKSDQGTKKNDQDTKKNGQGTEKNDQDTKKNNQGTKKNDQGTNKNGQDTKYNDKGTNKSDQGTKKNDQGTKKNDQGTKKNDQGTKKNDQHFISEDTNKHLEKRLETLEEKRMTTVLAEAALGKVPSYQKIGAKALEEAQVLTSAHKNENSGRQRLGGNVSKELANKNKDHQKQKDQKKFHKQKIGANKDWRSKSTLNREDNKGIGSQAMQDDKDIDSKVIQDNEDLNNKATQNKEDHSNQAIRKNEYLTNQTIRKNEDHISEAIRNNEDLSNEVILINKDLDNERVQKESSPEKLKECYKLTQKLTHGMAKSDTAVSKISPTTKEDSPSSSHSKVYHTQVKETKKKSVGAKLKRKMFKERVENMFRKTNNKKQNHFEEETKSKDNQKIVKPKYSEIQASYAHNPPQIIHCNAETDTVERVVHICWTVLNCLDNPRGRCPCPSKISKGVKESLDCNFSPGWQVVVGRKFSLYVSPLPNTQMAFRIGRYAFYVFKTH